jgi:hypothetical protein
LLYLLHINDVLINLYNFYGYAKYINRAGSDRLVLNCILYIHIKIICQLLNFISYSLHQKLD